MIIKCILDIIILRHIERKYNYNKIEFYTKLFLDNPILSVWFLFSLFNLIISLKDIYYYWNYIV